MIKAQLRFTTHNARESESLIRAVGPDNVATGLKISGHRTKSGASFNIVFDGRIETFISTLDDLVQCLQAAVGTLTSLVERNKE